MTILQKFNYLLPKSSKKSVVFLFILMFLGMLFEMLGVGILLPALAVIFNPNYIENYPKTIVILEYLGNPPHSKLVLYALFSIIFIYVIKAFFLLFVNWRQNIFSNSTLKRLEDLLFRYYLDQPYAFHLRRNSAVLLRNFSEISQLADIIQVFISLIIEISAIIGVVGLIIYVEPNGALIVASFLVLLMFVFHRFTKTRVVKWGEERQNIGGIKNQILLQGLGGVKDIKLMNRGEHFLFEYSQSNYKLSKIRIKVNTLSQIPRLYIEVFAVIGLVAFILTMLAQNKPVQVIIPTLGIFAAAAFRLIPSVNRIMAYMQGIQMAKPVINLLYNEFKLLNASIILKEELKDLKFDDKIVFKNIWFRYSSKSKLVLEDISLEIKKGETVGFIGPSGSGKSTLIDLLLGLLEPENGEIIIDKMPLKSNIRAWQNKIGYVPQSIYLTDDSLMNNIAFGIDPKYIDKEAVIRAVNAAQLSEFILNLDEGLNTFVGERGVRLSGGQRQRIGIARALYHNPSVLILDEATSSLDNETEKGFMEAINNLKREKTIVIVAHRLSTVSNCDKIFKLKNGKLIQEGIPSEVLKTT
jgi:ABC-type multidrug transport system fused ATPase/permease subunit